MNLQLSKRGDYVVRAALCLARAYETGAQRKIREVVAEMGVPQNYASQILSDLVKAGIAASRAGRGGGYMLVRDPGAITLLEVVEAAEGPLAPDRCTLGDGPCRWDHVCPLHETWTEATAALRSQLAQTHLADLTRRDREHEAGLFLPPTSHRKGRRSVEVEDWIHVECALDTITGRLQQDGWLSQAVDAAYREAEVLRTHIDPAGVPWTGIAPAVATVSPPTASADDHAKLQVEWDLPLKGGTDSRLDGGLELRSLDPQRTEVHLAGRFRPPGPAGIQATNTESADRLTRATVRSFLRHMAKAI